MALAPPRLTMMLAWPGKIWARPMDSALQPALVDEAPRPHPIGLLEDGTGRREGLQVRVALAAPFQVFLDHALKIVNGLGTEAEGDGEDHVGPVVEDAIIVAEPEVGTVDLLPDPLLRVDLRRFHHLLDEHRSVTSRGGGEEMEILPDGPADGAGDAGEVMEAAQASLDRGLDKVGEDEDPRARPHAMGIEELYTVDLAPDDQPSDPSVCNEDVGTPAQEECRDFQLSCQGEGGAEVIGCGCPEEEVCRAPDAEGGKRRQRHPLLDPAGAQVGFKCFFPAGWVGEHGRFRGKPFRGTERGPGGSTLEKRVAASAANRNGGGRSQTTDQAILPEGGRGEVGCGWRGWNGGVRCTGRPGKRWRGRRVEGAHWPSIPFSSMGTAQSA